MRNLARALMISAVMMLFAMPCFAESNSGGIIWSPFENESDLEAEECFEKYANSLFGIGTDSSARLRAKVSRRQSLSKDMRVFYDVLKLYIAEVARGERSGTVFTIEYTCLMPSDDTDALISALLFDCPYELYWLDKAGEYGISFDDKATTFYFPVNSEYADSAGAYLVDTSQALHAVSAASRAEEIIETYSSVSDYQKLTAYKNAICNLVSYNYAAMEEPSAADHNAWELIWVFDGDESTNVVCEGYSKAFKYLCDNTVFSDSRVYTYCAEGYMNDSSHMWNLVHMENGKVYLADITNCDSGSIGEDDKLFMVGYESGSYGNYVFRCDYGEEYTPSYSEVTYTYDLSTLELYSADELRISENSYLEDTDSSVIAAGTCGENDSLTWKFDADGALTVSGTGALQSAAAGDYNDEPWGEYHSDISSIFIGSGVTSIGSYAFYGLENLTSVTIFNRLLEMNEDAFIACGDFSIHGFSGSTAETFAADNSITFASIDAPAEPVEVTVIITGNHQTLDCDGEEHSVSGFTVTYISEESYSEENIFCLVDPEASGTTVGRYQMGLKSNDFQNTNDNYTVTFVVIDGYLTINEGTAVVSVIASGTWGTCEWEIDGNGILTIHEGTGEGYVAWWEKKYARQITAVVATEHIVLPENSASVFSIRWVEDYEAHSRCTSMDLSGVDTSNVTSMRAMFDGDTALQSLDLSGFDTSNVTDMWGMFSDCRNLTNLDISGFDTSKVTDMYSMFFKCMELPELDVSGFDTSNVVNMSMMFHGCRKVAALDVSGFRTDLVTNMENMFYECNLVPELDVSCFNTSNVTNMHAMFANCVSLEELDVSGFETGRVTDFSNMFQDCWKLNHIDVSGFDTSSAEYMYYMFFKCASLTELDVSNFNSSKVKSMEGMFMFCDELLSLNVSGLETQNTKNMFQMFADCSKLKTLDVTGFDTGNAEDMGGMFIGCSSLEQLDVSGFDTRNVKNMCNMFCYCESLEKLDVSGFNANNVDDIRAMFMGCFNLKELDISKLHLAENTRTEALCWNCSQLEQIILPDTIKNIDSNAFSNCAALKSIKIPERTTSIDSSAFAGCSNMLIMFGHSGSYAEDYAAMNDIRFVSIPENILTLPVSLTAIESEAFAGVATDAVRIPATVSSIADDAFEEEIIILAPLGSYAAGWGEKHNYVVIIE